MEEVVALGHNDLVPSYLSHSRLTIAHLFPSLSPELHNTRAHAILLISQRDRSIDNLNRSGEITVVWNEIRVDQGEGTRHCAKTIRRSVREKKKHSIIGLETEREGGEGKGA